MIDKKDKIDFQEMPFKNINIFNFANTLSKIGDDYVSIDQLKDIFDEKDYVWQAHLNNPESSLMKIFDLIKVGRSKNLIEKEQILSLGLLLCSGAEDDRTSILFGSICE